MVAMHFKQFYDTDLAQGSYLLACQQTGQAVVVDPRRDVAVYLAEAAAKRLRIVAVTETHIHADYLSGARELAQSAQAPLYLSNEGGEQWQYRFDHLPLRDGDLISLGSVELKAVHTPGHTPEHIAFLVTDRSLTDEPGYLLSGDFVFVGDVGRPDLLDEAAGEVGSRFVAARELFRSLKDNFLTLGDHLQVWPGHGAGSACGKALGAVASTTVGYERRTAWWRGYLEAGDVDGFVEELLAGQPDAPSYFGRMKRQNRDGPARLGERPKLKRMTAAELVGRVNRDLILIDTRPTRVVWTDSVPGALTIPGGTSFATYASWVLDPEADPREIVLLAKDEATALNLRDRLGYIGVDRVTAYVTDLQGLERRPVPLISPKELDRASGLHLVDVRAAGEFALGAIPGAAQIHAGRLLARLDELPRGGKLVLNCRSGPRASVVASALRARGFSNVLELEGSYEAWLAKGRERV